MQNHDPNQSHHPNGRLVFGLKAARDILKKEAKIYDDKFGDSYATFDQTAEWSKRRDAYHLAGHLLQQKIDEIVPSVPIRIETEEVSPC